MEILREWFLWGESDLFFVGVAFVIVFILLPWKIENNALNYLSILIGLVLYALAELVVSVWYPNAMSAYICLFVGGFALSAAVGRVLRLCWVVLNICCKFSSR